MTTIASDMSIDELESVLKQKKAEAQQEAIERLEAWLAEAAELKRELDLLPGVSAANLLIAQAQQARSHLPGVADLERQINRLRGRHHVVITRNRMPRQEFVVDEVLKHGIYFASSGRLNVIRTLQAYLGRTPNSTEGQTLSRQLQDAGIN